MIDFIILEISSDNYNPNALSAQILSHEACVIDPGQQNRILVLPNPNSRAKELENRGPENSSEYLFATPWLQMNERRVTFCNNTRKPEAIAVMKSVAQKIMDEYSPRVFSEHEGDEWTGACGGKIDIMFEFDSWAPCNKTN